MMTSSYSTRIDVEAEHRAHLRRVTARQRKERLRALQLALAILVAVLAAALFGGPLMWLASR